MPHGRSRLVAGIGLAARLGLVAAAASCATSPGNQTTTDPVPDGAEGGVAGTSGSLDQTGGYPSWAAAVLAQSLGAGAGGVAGAVVAGGTGGSGVAAEVCEPKSSVICGDGVRGPGEECDDGMGRQPDLCTAKCQVSDTLVERHVPTDPWDSRARWLGAGRHPVAGLIDAAALVYLEPSTTEADSVVVGLSVFARSSGPRLREWVSQGTRPALLANPVVASLPGDALAVAWTDFDGDGDELGIALRRIELSPYAPASISHANQTTRFAQYDPDILSVGDAVIVAWTDVSDAVTGPDVRQRRFSASSLAPLSDEVVLEPRAGADGAVSLAPFGAGWVTAWRAGWEHVHGRQRETIEIQEASGTAHWSVGPHLGAGPEDRPALAALDDHRLLLFYTVGTDPEASTVANTGRLRWVVLDTAGPTELEGLPLELEADGSAADPALVQSHPAALRAGEHLYLSWRTVPSGPGPRAEDVWLLELELADLADPTAALEGAVLLPRWPDESLGDQRFPALALAEHNCGPALAAAWDDYGQVLGNVEGEPDVIVQLAPVPILRGPRLAVDCTVEEPCGAGEGDCDDDTECEGDLVCGEGLGPNFGWAPDFGICVPAHCVNGVQDSSEDGVDCGGPDCGVCLCGDGVVLELVGEECDDGGESATCDADCTRPECGDGTLNRSAGEICEPSLSAACLPDCSGFDYGAVCLDPATCLLVQHQAVGDPLNQDIGPWVRVVNHGSDPVPLAELTIRYWFTFQETNHDASELQSYCDWAEVGCSTITRGFVELDPPLDGADAYYEIGFTGGTVLAPGQNSGSVQTRIAVTDWPGFDETDDYSYDPHNSFTDAPLVTLYRNGQLVWGVEPGGSLRCGDGVVDVGESCDTAGESSTCDADCTLAVCGDGVLNRSAGEQCDDGNQDDSDACPGSCEPATCGDGYVRAGVEQCDPGSAPDCLADCSGLDPTAPCLRVRYRDGDYGQASNADLKPYLEIVSECSGPVSMADLELRYWYRRAPCTQTQVTVCDWAEVGRYNVLSTTREVSPARTGADRYLRVRFGSGAGSIAPGSDSGEIQMRVHGTYWCTLYEGDDYSYDPSKTSYADWERVTLYRSGHLVWGVEPAGPPSCDDGLHNGNETDIDCGGSCEACPDGRGCGTAADCQSGVCEAGHCAPPACDDAVRNGDETDTDCGGPSCPACGVGSSCLAATDCQSGVCTAGLCQAPSCSDGLQNGTETDQDCGGGACPACAIGASCLEGADCVTGACAGGVCQAHGCADGVHNGDESDVDCGGFACPPCAVGQGCVTSADCATGLCLGGACRLPGTCSDSAQNQDETDVDCGGSECPPCSDGLGCVSGADCESGHCLAGVCAPASCSDGVQNGGETGLDCGGATSCPRCGPAGGCVDGSDCQSGVCAYGLCMLPTCSDQVHNGSETDVDCGGPWCDWCQDGASCAADTDCVSRICIGGICQPPGTCTDGVMNGRESDVDCGGTCPACAAGQACYTAADCQSGVCSAGVCAAPTCDDGVQNQGESDVDCGGSTTCPRCEPGRVCTTGTDCDSQSCVDGVCQPPTCSDGIHNGTESDVDCGGSCAACPDGSSCGSATDCTSGVCTGGVCQAPTCSDGVPNQDETGVDCGGGTCGPCGNGQGCVVDEDCTSGVCTGGVCQAPTCSDGVHNGSESDVDCGGAACAPCADGSTCTTDADCQSANCVGGICQAAVASCLKVRYREADGGRPSNSDIRPHLSVVNECAETVALTEIELRYWYLRAPCTQSQVCDCYYSPLPGQCTYVQRSFAAVSPARTGADYYLRVRFLSGAGSLAPGQSTGEIQLHVHGSSWCTLQESDDYSYDPTKTTLSDWERVTLYRNGTLTWGTEP